MAKKLKYRYKSSWGRGLLLTGGLSVLIGFLVYKYVTLDWIYQSYQEIVGFGLISIIAGIIYILGGKKTKI